MNNQAPALLSALVNEAFALKHLPGGNLLGLAIEQLSCRGITGSYRKS